VHCKYSAWVWDKWHVNEVALRANTITQFVEVIQNSKQGVSAKAWPVCFAVGMLKIWKKRNDRV
jgi:hypothetical protein